MKKIIVSVGLLMLFGGTPLFAQTETSGSTVYRATAEKKTQLKHTKLKVSFDYEKEQMHGEEWLTVSPYFYASDSLILDAKAMLIHDVALDQNGTKKPLNYAYKDDFLKIKLDKTYQKNQEYTLYIKYTARPNEVKQKGSAAISDAKGLYFINAQGKDPNKPIQIWTQGETEASSVWFPTIDKPNQKTTQEIFMTVPDKYVTLSNGILKNSKKETNGLRTDHWVMDKPHAPYLFFMGIGDFAVVKDKWKNIAVDYYVEKEYEPYAKQIFGNTPEMMDFYSKKLNYEYPWAKYAQMVARDYVSGAMENTTATLHGESAQQKPGALIDENKWEYVIAHELFHHWFGDLVTTESWSNLTVNESFANYSEYLWIDHKYGKDEADYHLMSDLSQYIHNPSDFKKDLVRFDYASKEDMFDLVSYNKGGGILHMLRNYLGDEAFFAGISDYLKTYQYGTAEAHQLRLSLEKISGKDLNWFFNQWYFGNGNPTLAYTFNYEPVKKQTTITINQTQTPLFQFPLTIDVYDNGKPIRHKVWVNAKNSNTFTFDSSKKPDLININADGILLSKISENKTPEQWLMQFSQSKDFKSRYKAIESVDGKATDAVNVKLIFAALKDPSHRIRQKAISYIDLTKSEHKTFISELEKLASSDPKTLVQGAAIGALGKLKDKKYSSLFEKGLTAVSNSVKGNSLAAMAALDPSKIIEAAKNIEIDGNDEALMSALLPVIVNNKIESQMPAISSTVAFYPFIKFQDPALGKVAEEGFNWIMTSDNLKATEGVTKIITQVKSQMAENPQAKMMMVQTLKTALAKKMDLLKQNPTKASSINPQIDLINKAIEAYK